jgi:hypothetical protein
MEALGIDICNTNAYFRRPAAHLVIFVVKIGEMGWI